MSRNNSKILKRYQLINLLIKENNYKNYLEIGVYDGENIKNIICDTKDSVDPYIKDDKYNDLSKEQEYPVNYRITSDEFFEQVAPKLNYKYDIIFIDGLHLTEQVDKDIENSLKYLNENGTIVLHDCNPSYELQIVPRIYEYWSGDVWKSIIKLKHNRNDLDIFVVDTDTGLGVISKKENIINKTVELEKKLEWNYFDKNKKELLNLISITDFIIKIYKNKL